ncbi:MAG: hypothetical protein WCO56_16880 [Verrucomicrobiota bacterium]
MKIGNQIGKKWYGSKIFGVNHPLIEWVVKTISSTKDRQNGEFSFAFALDASGWRITLPL